MIKKFQELTKSQIYIKNDNDKVNLYADDKVQQKQFFQLKEVSVKDEILHKIKILFDDISNDELEKFYNINMIN